MNVLGKLIVPRNVVCNFQTNSFHFCLGNAFWKYHYKYKRKIFQRSSKDSSLGISKPLWSAFLWWSPTKTLTTECSLVLLSRRKDCLKTVLYSFPGLFLIFLWFGTLCSSVILMHTWMPHKAWDGWIKAIVWK